MNKTRSGKTSLGQLVNYFHQVANTGMSGIGNPLSDYDVQMAKSALYHVGKLRRIIKGFHDRINLKKSKLVAGD